MFYSQGVRTAADKAYLEGERLMQAGDNRGAIACFERGAAEGCMYSLFNLGSLLGNDNGGLECWQKVVDSNSPPKEVAAGSHFYLGCYLQERAEQKGSGAEPLLRKAYGHFRKCYELDPSDLDFKLPAMHRVAIALWDGRGCAVDRVKALRLLRKNAEEYSHAPAMRFLASRLSWGDGVTRDVAEALKLWERAAVEGGDKESMKSLAALYLEGKFGVPVDLSQAARWATLAGGDLARRVEASFESPEAFRDCCAKHKEEAKKHSKLATAPLFPGTRLRLSRVSATGGLRGATGRVRTGNMPVSTSVGQGKISLYLDDDDGGKPRVVKIETHKVDVICDHCGKLAKLRCTQCKAAAFCSVGCQKAAWQKHKSVCKERVKDDAREQAARPRTCPLPDVARLSRMSIPEKSMTRELRFAHLAGEYEITSSAPQGTRWGSLDELTSSELAAGQVVTPVVKLSEANSHQNVGDQERSTRESAAAKASKIK